MTANSQAAGLLDRTGVRTKIACDVIGALIADYAEITKIERSRLKSDEDVLRDAPFAFRSYGFAQNDAERPVQRVGA